MPTTQKSVNQGFKEARQRDSRYASKQEVEKLLSPQRSPARGGGTLDATKQAVKRQAPVKKEAKGKQKRSQRKVK